MSGELLSRWSDACRQADAVASPADVEAAGVDLLRRWSEPHRHYHDRTHLLEVLARLDDLDEAGHREAHDPLVALGAWFHDAVHHGNEDDESASAALAGGMLDALGLPHGRVQRVTDLVLATADHAPRGDRGADALCDADLAVLGADDERYTTYRLAVRAEYAALDDDQFARGRTAVLRALVDRPWIFATAAGRDRWELAARHNVAAELAALNG